MDILHFNYTLSPTHTQSHSVHVPIAHAAEQTPIIAPGPQFEHDVCEAATADTSPPRARATGARASPAYPR